ncbi:hypothetical protein DAPPUDRAFT_259251 [Daphnia pulex]|uniref:Uncharacterized protein n=1 Tax=Daphnia pulex TaxID=6669 RepID=E9HGY3_DAPPU|nr:hypothetical protein DAPPUDRAFT_259251 [Daphnia pulex]|eukprot:EFX68963.1 hypothetical protein DAPPUDRAFT_259251 [Daphnia pulex]
MYIKHTWLAASSSNFPNSSSAALVTGIYNVLARKTHVTENLAPFAVGLNAVASIKILVIDLGVHKDRAACEFSNIQKTIAECETRKNTPSIPNYSQEANSLLILMENEQQAVKGNVRATDDYCETRDVFQSNSVEYDEYDDDEASQHFVGFDERSRGSRITFMSSRARSPSIESVSEISLHPDDDMYGNLDFPAASVLIRSPSAIRNSPARSRQHGLGHRPVSASSHRVNFEDFEVRSEYRASRDRSPLRRPSSIENHGRFGDQGVCLLIDKLAIDVRRNLTRHQGTADWTLDELRTAIKREIEIMEDTCELPPPRPALKQEKGKKVVSPVPPSGQVPEALTTEHTKRF